MVKFLDLVVSDSIPNSIPTFVACVKSDEAKALASGIWGFTGEGGEMAPGTYQDKEVILIGAGESAEFDLDAARYLGASFARRLSRSGNSALVISRLESELEEVSDTILAIAEGVLLGTYRYDALRSEASLSKAVKAYDCATLVVPTDWIDAANNAVSIAKVTARATWLARDLINEPAKTMTPKRFAEVASEVALTSHLEIRVWDEDDAERERLGGLLGVAAGSVQPPRMIRLSYRPKGDSKAKLALVGKGITFDSGGLSLKPGNSMMTMKTDMSGAAAVLAAMSTLAELDCPYEVNGYMALTENLPSGTATKPGDVLVTRSGKTIEVLNTDAEGRLVLSDALSLAVEDGAEKIVDLATLTGACVVALGGEIAGVMGNDDELIGELISDGSVEGESYWRLPLPKSYKKHIESEIADMRNIGEAGAAGAISAGLLLQEFVGETKWAHLDIAGPARSDKDSGIFAKGGTGFGTRTLIRWLTKQ